MADLTCPAYEGLLEPGARVRGLTGCEGIVLETNGADQVRVVYRFDDGPWSSDWYRIEGWLLDLRHHSEVTRLARHVAQRAGLDTDRCNVSILSWRTGLELQAEPRDGDEYGRWAAVLFHDGDTLGHSGKTVHVPGITTIPDAVGRLVRAAEVVCGE